MEEGIRFAQEGVSALLTEQGPVLRRARLLRTGAYPDKQVTLTGEDLESMVARFASRLSPIPVKVEHIDSVLDPLGELVVLEKVGDELFGTLALAPAIDAHLKARGAANVSAGIAPVKAEDGGGFRLFEVSLVLRPRIAGAGFVDVEQTLTRFTAEGKMTPAMEPFVRALLATPASVTFGESEQSMGEMVTGLLGALPVLFGRITSPPSPLSEAERGRLRETHPAVRVMAAGFGVTPEKVMAHW